MTRKNLRPAVPFHLPQPPEQPKPQAYEVVKGLTYHCNARGEVGETVTDLPAHTIAWLLQCGAIKPVEQESEAN